jgi:hypothetical protein
MLSWLTALTNGAEADVVAREVRGDRTVEIGATAAETAHRLDQTSRGPVVGIPSPGH